MAKLNSLSDFKSSRKSVDLIRSKATRYGGNQDDMIKAAYQQFTAEAGTNRIRLLPSGTDYWGIEVYMHWIDVDGRGRPFLCPKKMLGEDCPVCVEWKKAKDDEDVEYAKQCSYSQKLLVWCIDRAKESEGPKLYMLTKGMEIDINGTAVDEETNEVLPIDHPVAGYDVKFNKEGKGLTTKYNAVAIVRKSTPLSDDEATAVEWLNYCLANPLDGCVNVLPGEMIGAAFRGEVMKKVLTGEADEWDVRKANGADTGGPAPTGEEEEEPPAPAPRPAARPAAPAAAAPARRKLAPPPAEEEPPAGLDEEDRPPPTKPATAAGMSLRDRLAARNAKK